jgi:hypothetical protein
MYFIFNILLKWNNEHFFLIFKEMCKSMHVS